VKEASQGFPILTPEKLAQVEFSARKLGFPVTKTHKLKERRLEIILRLSDEKSGDGAWHVKTPRADSRVEKRRDYRENR